MGSKFLRDAIHCECGWIISVSSLVDDVSSDANTLGGSEQGEDTFVCAVCEREHKLFIEVQVEISVESSELTTFNPYTGYHDKDRNELKYVYFENLRIGDKTPNLDDGQYAIEKLELIYTIQNGEITNIFSSKVDPNQISMFDEAIIK